GHAGSQGSFGELYPRIVGSALSGTDGTDKTLVQAGQTRQLLAQQRTSVATALGPDGMLDGSLLFGQPGFLQVSDQQVWRFALSTISEGSRLRAWLRISRHTGTPVPWTLCFVNQPT